MKKTHSSCIHITQGRGPILKLSRISCPKSGSNSCNILSLRSVKIIVPSTPIFSGELLFHQCFDIPSSFKSINEN